MRGASSLYGLMIALALLYLIPFVYTVSTSLKSQAEAAAGFDLWPDSPSLAAYREIWSREDLSFVTFFKNSLILASLDHGDQPLPRHARRLRVRPAALPAARGRSSSSVLGTLMIPDQLRLVPVYLMMIDFPITDWNLTQTRHGYVFFGTSIALATNLFLMRQYFLTIPKDYEEAAKLDGAGYFKTYWRVMLPLAAPAVAAVAILTFQGIWNEFFWANLLLGQGGSDEWTVQIGVAQFRFQYQTLWPQLMAAATIAILPVLVGLHLLPALLRRRRRGGWGQGMIAAVATTREPGVGEVLRRAARDFYEESWRFVLLNSLLSAYVLVGARGRELRAAGARPAPRRGAAGSCPRLRSRDRRRDRLAHVRRGRSAACAGAGSAGSCSRGSLAARCARHGARGPLLRRRRSLRVAARRPRPLPRRDLRAATSSCSGRSLCATASARCCDAAAEAGLVLVRRPAAVVGLGLALLVVNVVGIVAAVLPFLTLTIAYSALAAARLALRPATPRGGVSPWRP